MVATSERASECGKRKPLLACFFFSRANQLALHMRAARIPTPSHNFLLCPRSTIDLRQPSDRPSIGRQIRSEFSHRQTANCFRVALVVVLALRRLWFSNGVQTVATARRPKGGQPAGQKCVAPIARSQLARVYLFGLVSLCSPSELLNTSGSAQQLLAHSGRERERESSLFRNNSQYLRRISHQRALAI